MSLTEIRKDIEQEADAEARSLHDNALVEKENILKEAKARASEIVRNYEKELNDELMQMEKEHDANLELQLKRIFLDAREDALKREINGVRSELVKEIKKNKKLYKGIFTRAIKEATSIAPSREITLVVNKRDADFVRGSGARVEYKDINGILIFSEGRDIKIDATLDTVIESKGNEIKSAILEGMFHERQVNTKPERSHKAAVKPAKKKSRSKKTKRKR